MHVLYWTRSNGFERARTNTKPLTSNSIIYSNSAANMGNYIIVLVIELPKKNISHVPWSNAKCLRSCVSVLATTNMTHQRHSEATIGVYWSCFAPLTSHHWPSLDLSCSFRLFSSSTSLLLQYNHDQDSLTGLWCDSRYAQDKFYCLTLALLTFVGYLRATNLFIPLAPCITGISTTRTPCHCRRLKVVYGTYITH